MKIYIAHANGFDFKKELYEPLRASTLAKQHEFIFPHEESGEPFNSKDLFESGCDLVIAEVSYPSTGLGIELGWAEEHQIPIVCIYKSGSKLSNALTEVSKTFFEYSNTQDLEGLLTQAIEI